MKIKLLKKVRKRFEIFHLPKGFVNRGEHYDYNLFKLIDNKNGSLYDVYAQLGKNIKYHRQYTAHIFDTEGECIAYLKQEIIERLRSEGHRQRKDKVIHMVQKKVWHV